MSQEGKQNKSQLLETDPRALASSPSRCECSHRWRMLGLHMSSHLISQGQQTNPRDTGSAGLSVSLGLRPLGSSRGENGGETYYLLMDL